MSRVGKYEIVIPAGVVVLQESGFLKIKGRLGEDSIRILDCLDLVCTEGMIKISPKNEEKFTRSMWGTTHRNVSNVIRGVSDGFTVNLDLVGVGYKASVSGKKLIMQLGFSHDVEYLIPPGVTINCDKPTVIAITSHSKKQVGDIAAFLRSYRKPEPYKGKGVIRSGEFVVRKEGKKK